MSPNDLIFIAALVLLALCAALVGFNFWAALGFALALGLVFYLVQSGTRREGRDSEKHTST
jgi:Flp pilus assembly protein TadB